jgi:hypothetical protein
MREEGFHKTIRSIFATVKNMPRANKMQIRLEGRGN